LLFLEFQVSIITVLRGIFSFLEKKNIKTILH
jgi:hypothetical protein